jgi:trans-aconitate 2-methyltransferase
VSSHTGAREWDAAVYDRVSQPQLEWGLEVIDRLGARGDEIVLDAGCGSGRVTEALIAAVPRGRVLAVDGSPSMVEQARRRLGDRADVWLGDLAELELDEPVELAFSNAVFHWIPDHERLFGRLHAALRPGGRLVAQCGGSGNVAALASAIREAASGGRFEAHLGDFGGIWNFAGADETAERLGGAGFADVRCWLETKAVRPEQPREYLRAVTLGPHLARLPADLQDPFLDAVAERMDEPLTLDYVRLNIDARRPT